MRLLVVSGAYPPTRAGEADHVFHICENLARRGRRCSRYHDSALWYRSRIRIRGLSTYQRLVVAGSMAIAAAGPAYFSGGRAALLHRLDLQLPSNDHFYADDRQRLDSRVRFVTEFANTEGAELTRFSVGTRALRKAMASWATPAGVDYSFGTLLRDSDSLIVLSRNHGDMLADRFNAAKQKTNLIPRGAPH